MPLHIHYGFGPLSTFHLWMTKRENMEELLLEDRV